MFTSPSAPLAPSSRFASRTKIRCRVPCRELRALTSAPSTSMSFPVDMDFRWTLAEAAKVKLMAI